MTQISDINMKKSESRKRDGKKLGESEVKGVLKTVSLWELGLIHLRTWEAS